jgi:hypothetical protein
MSQGHNLSTWVMPQGHKSGRKTIMTRLMGHKVRVYGISFSTVLFQFHFFTVSRISNTVKK